MPWVSLKTSNVDLSKEMTDLINVQRSYQFQSRTVTMADQMSGLVNGIR
ncbi:flagellar basal body rod C-terminal domain-containing protein [Peribacillus simplex]